LDNLFKNEIEITMKMYVGFILLCLFWVNQSVAQCAFQINKFIEEDQLAHVQTESKQIYESEEKLKSLGFSFGNIGADYYFIALTPELDEIWEVNKGDGLTFKFANNGLLYVDFDSFVASNEAYTPSGPYDRKSKEVRYFLPSKKLSQFIGSELVEIYFRYNGDGISIPIEEPMKKMHAQMFDCLYGRVEGYRMKYPNMSYDQYLQAQKKADENPEEKDLNLADSSIYKVVEVMPRFPGCESELAENKEKENCAKTKMLQYVYANLVYPEEAKSLELDSNDRLAMID